MNIRCPYCQAKAQLVSGQAIYPHRPDLFDLKFFQCRPCNAYVGTHKKSGEPLGTLANAQLRKLRNQAHAAFDPLWKCDRGLKRHEAYRWLAEKMDIDFEDCHIAMFDEDQCKEVIEIIESDQI